jgi:GNAT superfamily N-acetyltransferase
MLTVRLAVEQDSEDIASVMQAAVVEEMRQFTIVGCSGLSRYISDQICDHKIDHYVVCADGDRIVGMSGWRHVGRVLFLNHLFVHPTVQGRGAGRMLCQAGIALLRKPNEHIVSLDVFLSNERVRRWYRSLGMQPVFERVWVQFPLVDHEMGPTPDCKVLGMGDADRAHARYGFSEFTIGRPHMTHAVGRLGEFLFRSLAFDIIKDAAALSVLARLGRHRKLLCIGFPHDALYGQPARGIIVAESERMVGIIGDVMERLMHQSGFPHTHAVSKGQIPPIERSDRSEIKT